jgi:hypothetical protein
MRTRHDGSRHLEFLTEFQAVHARKIHPEVWSNWVTISAGLRLGREVRAALATEAQLKLLRFAQELRVDPTRGH